MVIYVFTHPSPTWGESKSTRLGFYWQRKETKHYYFVTYLTAFIKNKRILWGGRCFLQLFNREGIDDLVQVRRTQTCTRWLMIKLYINVRYDRLHWMECGMPMMQRTSSLLPVSTSLTRPNSHLDLAGDLELYCYSLVDREAHTTSPYLRGTQTSSGTLRALLSALTVITVVVLNSPAEIRR